MKCGCYRADVVYERAPRAGQGRTSHHIFARIGSWCRGPRRYYVGVNRMVTSALALALSTMLAGCTGVAARESSPMPASPKGGLPGSALVEDLRSPRGTVLLGGTFVRPNGAAALMLITGDPIVAFRDLVEQAQRAGFGLQPQSTVGPCWVSTAADNWWQDPGHALTEPVFSAVSGLGCAVAGWTATVGHTSRFLSLRLLVGAADQPYLAHLSLDYAVADNAAAVMASPTAPVRVPAVASPLNPRPLTQAKVGSVLALPFNTERKLQIASGSSLLAPPFPSDCAAGGFVAVLAVTGVVGSIVDSYAAQFARVGLHEQERSNPVGPNTDGTYLHATTAGGGDATITTTTANGDTWAMVTRCQD